MIDLISEDKVKTARRNFLLASKDFDFEFVSPFSLTDELNAFGYISNYGSKNGVVICLTSPPDYQVDKNVVDWCITQDYFYSFLNIEPLDGEYDPLYFREMLQDWRKY